MSYYLGTNCVYLEKAKIYTKSKNEALMNICEMPMSKNNTQSAVLESLMSKQSAWNVYVYIYMEFNHKILFCK